MNIAELVRELRNNLEAAGVPDPLVDAELLVGHIIGESRGRVQALAILGRDLHETDVARVRALGESRSERVPLQHLTGVAPFRGIELSVGPGVFVPRPETEGVAQHAIDALGGIAEPRVLELCTGSGALALALATEIPAVQVWAWEKSTDAHAWAQKNIAQYGDDRVRLTHGDVIDLLDDQLSDSHNADFLGKTHVLLSNPPYVPTGMVPRDPEVRDHDPELALYSGADGLDLIRVLSKIGLRYLVPGGSIVLEHAELQGKAIRDLLARDGWLHAATHRDLTDRDRCTTAVSPFSAGES